MATVEQNIANSKKFAEQLGTDKSLKFVDALVSPELKYHDATAPNLPKGPAGAKQFMQTYVTAFPDLKLTVVDSFGAGDKVATRWIAEGTNNGPIMGIPPTGKKVSTEGTTIDYYNADGKIVETYNSWDSHSFLMQLGLVAEAPEVRARSAEQRPGVQ